MCEINKLDSFCGAFTQTHVHLRWLVVDFHWQTEKNEQEKDKMNRKKNEVTSRKWTTDEEKKKNKGENIVWAVMEGGAL